MSHRPLGLVFTLLVSTGWSLVACESVPEPSVCEQGYACVIDAACRAPSTTELGRDLFDCIVENGSGAPACDELQTAYTVESQAWEACHEYCHADYEGAEFDEAWEAVQIARRCTSWMLVPEDERQYFEENLDEWEAACEWQCGELSPL